MEIFKDIKGYEGIYQASNTGRIRTLIKNKDGVTYLKEGITGSGYMCVTLCKDKKKKSKKVHRLIAIAFLGYSDKDVNHKDGNKLNNHIDNLEFVSKKENSQHAIKNGLFKPNYLKIAIETQKKVAQLDMETGNVLNVFKSAHEASRLTNINRGNISATCRGVKNNAGGYKWIFFTEK